MTTSGVSAYELTLNQIVSEAFSLAQILADGESLTAEQQKAGKSALNAMVKTWETDEPLWAMAQGTLVCTPNQQSFTLGPDGDFPIRALQIYSIRKRQITGSVQIDTPMLPMVKDEYFDLPQKNSAGIPTSYYYDPYNQDDEENRLKVGRLYVWPTCATGQTIELKFTYLRRLEDFVNAQNTPDLPAEWTECLVYNLAVRLGQRYGQGVEADIRLMAEQLKVKMMGWDRQQSVFVSPVGYGGYGYRS